MARIRTIKPEFFRHEGLQDLEAANPGKHVMLTFAALWGHCDKAGRFEWRPRTLKLDILPFLDFDMRETLETLRRAGFILKYVIDGKEYGEINSFEKHQRISGKEAQEPEKYPEPVEYEVGSDGEAPEKQQRLQEGKGIGREEEGKGKDINVALAAQRESVVLVFDHWRNVMGSNRAALDAKRKKLIEARLKDGYSAEDLCKAIEGCSRSPFHMGMNDKGTKYNGIDLILRSAEYVDKFVGFFHNPPKPMGKQAQIEAINRAAGDEFLNDSRGIFDPTIIEGEAHHAGQ